MSLLFTTHEVLSYIPILNHTSCKLITFETYQQEANLLKPSLGEVAKLSLTVTSVLMDNPT